MARDLRVLLRAAAMYNVWWGMTAILAPRRLSRVLGFDASGDGMGWRAAGVMVLAYAPAYVWAVHHPREARPILATALFGKTIGAVGWVLGVSTRRLRRRSVLLPLLNDVLWIPGLVGALHHVPAGGDA